MILMHKIQKHFRRDTLYFTLKIVFTLNIRTLLTSYRICPKIRTSPFYYLFPASGAQSNARPTGDEEVAASFPAGSATFFSGD